MDEAITERWKCYLELRNNYPETFGSVDLSSLDIDHYFAEIDNVGEEVNSKKRKVKFMSITIKAGIISAIVSLVVSVTVFVVVPGKGNDAEMQALSSQLQTITSIMQANYEDEQKRDAATRAAVPERASILDRKPSTPPIDYANRPFRRAE